MRTEMWLFGAFIGMFYAVGIGLLGYSLWAWRRSSEVGAWPTADGSIQSCKLENETAEDETFKVTVEYKYSVNGQEYTGNVLAFGYGSTSGKQAHQEILDKLKAAKSVQVHYHPQHPERSALSYGLHRTIKFTLAFALTWLSFVIGFTMISWATWGSDSVLLRNLVTQ